MIRNKIFEYEYYLLYSGEKEKSRKSILSKFAVKKQKNSKKIIDNGKIWNYNLVTFFSIIFIINF